MRKKQQQQKAKNRFFAGIGLGLLIVIAVGTFVFPIHRAEAFPGEALAAAVWKEARDQIRNIANTVASSAKEAYKITKDVAFKNALRIYLNKIAEDTATYIATGAPGQTSLFLTNPGGYFADIGDAALADYLDTVSSGTTNSHLFDFGGDNVRIDLALRSSLEPDFCRDGCQRDYELKLSGLSLYKQALSAIQTAQQQYVQAEVANAEAICSGISDQPTCDAEPNLNCAWKSTNPQSCEVAPLVYQRSRPLNDDDKNQSGNEQLAQIIQTDCTDTGNTSLFSCERALNQYIESVQSTALSQQQRCVQLCESASNQNKSVAGKLSSGEISAFSSEDFYKDFPSLFEDEQNPVGQFLFAYQAAREESDTAQQQEKETLDYSNVGPLRSIITGAILTPSNLTQTASEKPLSDAGTDVATYTGSPIADAIGVFTDSLTKKLIERIFNRQGGGFANPDAPSLLSGGYNSGGIAAAKAQFAKSFTPNVTRQSNQNFDSLSYLQDDQVIDQDFAEAVRQGLTVEAAIEKNLLHEEWWFGYNQNRQDSGVTGNGMYSAKTLPILRTHRIIPVGWEIAAQYNILYDDGSLTLAGMIEKFDDQDSPYFQLIDPKWVLKAPLEICAKQGYSGGITDGTCQSSQVVSISNDGIDTCEAGEHDTNGDGLCNLDDPPIYENTCEREQTCVDNQTCIRSSADGKGCEEYGYCTKELPVWHFSGEACDSQYTSCQAYKTVNNQLVSYLTDTTDSDNCSIDNVGCQRYCYRDTTSGEFECYNTTTNSFTGPQIYFDNDAQTCSADDDGCTELLRTVAGYNIAPNSSFEQFSGSYPVQAQTDFDGWRVGGSGQTCGAQSFRDTITTNGTYAMRLQRLTNACAGNPAHDAQVTVDISPDILADRSYTVSFNARAVNAPCTGNVTIANAFTTQVFTPEYTSEYRRYSDTITFPATSNNGIFFVSIEAPDACSLVIDDVKVERGASATQHTQYGDGVLSMKIPPPYLSCTGAADDDPECSQYALRCNQQNVGCSAFTPADGGITIPAQITDVSQCDLADPTSCDQCPAAFIGCKAFKEEALTAKVPVPTHSDRLSSGLVSIVPSSGRSCNAANVGCEEYTNLDKVAEGGEAVEYYSKVRQCVESSDGIYYFSWVGSQSTGFELKRWNLKESEDGTGAPCTNLAVSPSPNAACEDTAPTTTVNNCAATFGSDPNCIEFFDDNGVAHYRYLDEVIFATDECTGFRNSIDGNTYYFDPTESKTCSAQYAGCREYKGAATNNTRTLFENTFESSTNPGDGWIGGTVTTEALTFPGHSLAIGPGGAIRTLDLKEGKSYVLSFWAKTAGAAGNIEIDFDGAPANQYFTYDSGSTSLTLGTEWQLYRLGPVEYSGFSSSSLTIVGVNAYYDNIKLVETTQNLFLTKGSAASCDGYENCQQYRDQNNATHTLKGFSNLCQSAFVGCEALINTRNSDTPDEITLAGDQSYLDRATGIASNIVPGDSVDFFVNDSDKYCASSAQGCQELGEPVLKQDGSVERYETRYIKSDPETYDTALCSSIAVGCQQYSEVENGSLAFFKDPGQQTCEYRTDVGPSNIDGWFKKDSDDLCDEPWTRSCPSDQSTCREYFSPRIYNNPAAPDDQNYYYLASNVTTNECPQGIDPNDSCIGFEDQKQGPNTLRAKLDPDDPDTVVSQSCRQCSSDQDSCGRNDNAPCCEWNGSICSTDASVGGDSAAPYYCIFSSEENDFQRCSISSIDSYAVPNASNPADATNCGAPGQPQCFDMSAAVGAPDAYDASSRYCGDFACTANTVLKVTPDRMCSEWLECVQEETVTRDGKEITVCLKRELASTDGPVYDNSDNKQDNLVKSSPSETKDLANYSGFVKAGMISANNELVDGLYPYSQFEETGIDGAFIEIPDANFETHKIAAQESPIVISSNDTGGLWIDSEVFDWFSTRDEDGPTSLLRLEKTDSPDNFSNQYLAVSSQDTKENGVAVTVDSGTEITEDVEFYMLSFRAKKKGTLARGIRMDLYQDGVGSVFLDSNSSSLALTTGWENYVVQLTNNAGVNIDPEGADIQLRFLHRDSNVPSETFYIDDVKLKPVLHIQDATSGTPEPGLLGYYFQAEMQEAPGAQDGLAGEFWDSAQSFSNVNWVSPDATATTQVIDYDPTGPAVFPPSQGQAFSSSQSAEWNGGIYITDSTETTFYFNQNDGAQLFIEDLNTPIINKTTPNASLGYSGKLAGVPTGWHPVRIKFVNNAGNGGLQFGWHPGIGGANLGISTDGIHYDWDASISGVTQWVQIQDALAAIDAEFPQCGLWGNTAYWQSCLGGDNPNIFCNSDADCGTGTCESFKLCTAPDQSGSLVPTNRLTTALEINRDNAFSYLIDSDVDLTVDFANFNDRLTEMAKRGDAVAVRWVGEVNAETAGTYQFHVEHKDGARLYIDGNLVIDNWTDVGGALVENTGLVDLSVGWHALRLEYYKNIDVNQDVAVVRLGWTQPGAAKVYPIPSGSLRNYPPAPTGFVQRECRSYPQSDSLVCDYSDPQSGVQYRGWQGYCVERDPRDDKVCLNWWPIDVLAGETNIFSDQDQSLTRSPLYYCAETQKKTIPSNITFPRWVCVSAASAGGQCNWWIKVSSPTAAFYSLIGTKDWKYGQVLSTPIRGLDDTGEDECFGSCVDMSSSLVNFPEGAIDANPTTVQQFVDQLKKYYNRGESWAWMDEGCGTGHVDDSMFEYCSNTDDDRYDRDSFFVTREDWNTTGTYDPTQDSYPLECSTLVQVTQKDGTSTPWTSKVQSGAYTTHPLTYTLGAACAPYGALPVFENPSDIVNCIPNPSDPAIDGCQVVNGACVEIDLDGDPATNPTGSCIKAPIEIYHPYNYNNNNPSSICSQTRLGAGFYSCGSNGLCKTCQGGENDGLACVADADCGTDGLCNVTYGSNEAVGTSSDLFAQAGQVVPADPPLTTVKTGIARMKQLFARSYGFWEWSADIQKYVRKKDAFGRDYPNWEPPQDDGRVILNEATNTVTNYGTATNPVAGGMCNTRDYHKSQPNLYCGIRPLVSNITVSGGETRGSDIILSGNNRAIVLEFDYEIDPDQSPIKKTTIAWGDSSPSSAYTSASARKSYQCEGGSNGCLSCPGGVIPQGYDHDNNPATYDIQACIYDNFPRVQITDNWDWCNVKATSSAYGCQTASSEWDAFQGRIVVLP